MNERSISSLLIRALRYAIDAPLYSSPKPLWWCANFRLRSTSPPSSLELYHFSQRRWESSSSSKRWQSRQVSDHLTKLRKIEGHRSRASYKLVESEETHAEGLTALWNGSIYDLRFNWVDQMHSNYKLFKPGMTVVDLGYAPGSWTEVAVAATKPGGRVIGVDIIPATPPKGASTIQGNFQDPAVQLMIKRFLADPNRGRLVEYGDVFHSARIYLEMERHEESEGDSTSGGHKHHPIKQWIEEASKRTVDVLLSDMFGPWEQVSGHWMNSLTKPYRMMNTSGIRVRDHELCLSALLFGIDVLKPGGSFICKFYAGDTDHRLEARLAKSFDQVIREKPRASRKESKEMFFVAKGFKQEVNKLHILEMYSAKEEIEDKIEMEVAKYRDGIGRRVVTEQDEWDGY